MSEFMPKSRHPREVLLFRFITKKSAVKVHRMLSDTYGEAAFSARTGREWFQRFKNGDFDVEDRHGSGRDKVFKDEDLEALLDQDAFQTQEELADSLHVAQQAVSKRLKDMRMTQKLGHWVPYDLKPRDVERRFFICEQLLERHNWKKFLHRIVTGHEKWVHYDNPKRRKSWESPDTSSRRRPNRIFTGPRSCFVFGGTN
ncbi:hypothetical protein RP20_CCG010945 [Aedes albopictus]|nr:hypothetical protein RP20_CCG010945 [Aedes albopictus]